MATINSAGEPAGEHMHAECWEPCAEVDLAALRHNAALAAAASPGSRICAVVKANAYGHGMEVVAQALLAPPASVIGLAVARLDEAMRLRAAGIVAPTLVLEGVNDDAQLAVACGAELTLALHRPDQIDLLERQPRDQPTTPLAVWLKVDTGMHRLGLAPELLPAAIRRLRALGDQVGVHGLLTHLANADRPADPTNDAACALAWQLALEHGLPLSIGNSAGILALPMARSELVRPGIMLYGGSPLAGRSAAELALRPVMTLRARLIACQRLARGAAVGYGGTYVCPEAMPVGLLAIGYGDGYPRHAPSGTPVLLHGQRVPLLGRVSMDSVAVDLRAVPQAQVGDWAVLWGAGLPVEEIAVAAGTINYELLCRLSPRVTVRYVGG